MSYFDLAETRQFFDYMEILIAEKDIGKIIKHGKAINRELKKEKGLLSLTALEKKTLKEKLLIEQTSEMATKFWVEFFDKINIANIKKRISTLNLCLEHARNCVLKAQDMSLVYRHEDLSILIAQAKQVPIKVLLSSMNIKINSMGMCCCIAHTEKTPSMHVYEDTNTWHCFSCQKSGDTIDVIQILNGYDFVNAVKSLAKGY